MSESNGSATSLFEQLKDAAPPLRVPVEVFGVPGLFVARISWDDWAAVIDWQADKLVDGKLRGEDSIEFSARVLSLAAVTDDGQRVFVGEERMKWLRQNVASDLMLTARLLKVVQRVNPNLFDSAEAVEAKKNDSTAPLSEASTS